MTALVLLASAGPFFSVAAGASASKPSPHRDAVLVVGRHRYYLQLAVTQAEQDLGLGDRPKLPPDRGMLFVFPASSTRCFWMKGMRFALDMIWLSSTDAVVSVQPDVSPKTYPSVYCAPAQDVIELDAGQAHAAGIVVNRVVTLEMPGK
jgi:uncharacterized protein